jgi:hypothetical protein
MKVMFGKINDAARCVLSNKQIIDIHSDASITALAYDCQKYENAIDFCNLYLEILGVDRTQFSTQEILTNPYIPKFYISELKATINNLPNRLGEKLSKFFHLDNSGPRHYLRQILPNDRATMTMANEASKALEYLISFSAMYQYNAKARSVINRIASKVRDPEGQYSNVEKMKYAHIYYRYIKDFQRMPNDSKKGERVLNEREKAFEMKEKSYQNIGMLEEEWSTFFKDIPDGDIILSQVKLFLRQIETSNEQAIRFDAQLDEDRCIFVPYYVIRAVKESVFDSGEWINGDYMRVSSLNTMKASHVRELCRTWQKYAEEFEWTAELSVKQQVLFLSEGYKEVEIPAFNKKALFKDEQEVLFFCSLLEYFRLNEPDFRYHGKLLSKYDFYEFLH